MGNEKPRCNKFFWGLKFELRDRIANIPKNSLTKIINVVANHKLILELEKTATMNNPTPKSSVPIIPVIESLEQQSVENPNNFNKMKRQFKCRNCGMEHSRKCVEPLKFFNCRKIGYMKMGHTTPPKEKEDGKRKEYFTH